jgi:acyl-CoA thioesterase I
MLKTAALLVVLAVIVAGGLAWWQRAQWIDGKIAALTAPASTQFASANASLPRKGAKPRIVLIGDSRIAQWPAAALPERFEIINRGIGGETVAQLAQRFQTDAIALDPDLIVVQAGINDLVAASLMDEKQGDTVKVLAREALLTLAKRAHAAGRKVLVTAIIPPAAPELIRRPVWSASLPGLVADVNAELKRIQTPGSARVIDIAAGLAARDPKTLDDAYRTDALHLNDAGYIRLGEALAAEIERMLGSPPSSRVQ